MRCAANEYTYTMMRLVDYYMMKASSKYCNLKLQERCLAFLFVTCLNETRSAYLHQVFHYSMYIPAA